MRFSYYKSTNCTAPCNAMHYYMQCSYAILQAVLVRFLQFGEHSCLWVARFYGSFCDDDSGLLGFVSGNGGGL